MAFTVVLILVGVLGFAAVDRLTGLSHTVDLITGDSLAGTDALAGMREGLLRYRLVFARYVATGTQSANFKDVLDGAEAIGREAATLRAEVDQFLAAVEQETTEARRVGNG